MIRIMRHDSMVPPDIRQVPFPDTRQVALIYADPPFNIGVRYDAHNDSLPKTNYWNFAYEWLHAFWPLLREQGFLVICCAPELTYLYQSLLENMGGAFSPSFLERVVWHRTFGAQSNHKNNLSKAYTDIVIYQAQPRRGMKEGGCELPNWRRWRVPSARQAMGDRWADPNGKIPGAVWQIPDNPRSDVWTVPMVCGTFKERVGWHPAQQPLELVCRLVRCLTNKGDLVVDPFSGAGTTAVACKILRRDCYAFDISPKYVRAGRERLEEQSDLIASWRERLGSRGTGGTGR